VNLHVGYHYHAVTNCLDNIAKQSDDAPIIGIAMDGYKIMTHLSNDQTVPLDLDQCNGHTSSTEGYHYHAGAPGSNAIVGCLSGEAGCVSESPGQPCDASQNKRPPRGDGQKPPGDKPPRR